MAEEQYQPAIQVDSSHMLLIVVGAHLRAEIADRPLAYLLRDRIEQWIRGQAPALNVPIVPVVCTDVWYINEQSLQNRPTISLGGPGVNALSNYYTQRISPALLRDNKIFIQLDPEFVDLRACVWGMDHALTIEAMELFIDRFLDNYLRAVATQVEPEEEG